MFITFFEWKAESLYFNFFSLRLNLCTETSWNKVKNPIYQKQGEKENRRRRAWC